MVAVGWVRVVIRMSRLARMVLLLFVEGRAELRTGWKMAALPCGSRAERFFVLTGFNGF
jgi:hypothetical protein